MTIIELYEKSYKPNGNTWKVKKLFNGVYYVYRIHDASQPLEEGNYDVLGRIFSIRAEALEVAKNLNMHEKELAKAK